MTINRVMSLLLYLEHVMGLLVLAHHGISQSCLPTAFFYWPFPVQSAVSHALHLPSEEKSVVPCSSLYKF